MMDWCTYPQYCVMYPDDSTTVGQDMYDCLAYDAYNVMMRRTYRRVIMGTTAAPETLARCQAKLVHAMVQDAAVDDKTAGGVITAASADGYSESYADADTQRDIKARKYNDIVSDVLGADPVTAPYLSRGCW